ncbi:MAG: FtsK/SpoIIIE domain-containing protein [Chloroflexota bacterium]
MTQQQQQQEPLPTRGPQARAQRLDHRLHIQAAGIEAVFERHELAAQVAGGQLDAHCTRFVLHGDLPTRRQTLRELEQDLADSLNVRRARVVQENGAFYVELEQGQPPAVGLLDLLQRTAPLPPYVAALGWTTDERPLLFNLAAEDSTHMLLAGAAGAGKTTLLRTIALSLALHNRQSEVQMLFIDPDTPGSDAGGVGLHAMTYLPHVLTGLVTQIEDVADVLAFLEDEMGYRARHRIWQPRIVVFVDRLASLLQEDEGPIRQALHGLLLRGPAAGIQFALSTRRPQDAVLRQALPRRALLRVAGHVSNAEEAQAALRAPDTGAEHLLGRGDFLARVGESTVRFQGAYVDEYDLHLCVERLHRRRPPALVARSLNARERLAQVADGASGETFFYDGSQITWAVQAEE